MAGYGTEDIRNIALVGHSGAGKTLLTEALLHRAGAIATPGSIEKGTTVCDFEPEERDYRHSLSAAVVGFDYHGRHINLIDTPGLPDFLGHTLAALPAVETIAVVINAQTGIESVTRRIMDWAAANHFCRMLVVNKIDLAPAQLPEILEQIRDVFGRECLPLNLPAKSGDGVVDCFFHASAETGFSSARAAHTAVLDQVVELDERLMDDYLAAGDVEPGRLHAPFEQALRDGHLIPICFTSSRTGMGLDELLEVFAELAPNPREGNPHPFRDLKHAGQEIHPAPEAVAHILAHVFKLTHDPYVGKLGIFRIHQGRLNKDTALFVDEGRKPFKVAHLYQVQGKQYVETDQGIPGDIRAVGKIEEMHLNAILHNSHDEDGVRPALGRLPVPMVGRAIEAKTRGDEQKLFDAVEKLTAEDPCLVLERPAGTHELILRGLGELHVRIALERLGNRYHVDVETHRPAIPFRETATHAAEGHYRHKKQTGGAGQFGEVYLKVEPRERGAGFEFVDAVVGGAIPNQFIPAVEKGVRQAIASGAVAGYPIEDVRVVVHGGKHHPVDSQEVSFITAGRKAFLDAFLKAGPILLEPVVNARVSVPSPHVGDITGDLAARRARINETAPAPGGTVAVSALVPLAEMNDYASRLKSLTGGEGGYSMELSHYEPVPPTVQQKLVKQFRPAEED